MPVLLILLPTPTLDNLKASKPVCPRASRKPAMAYKARLTERNRGALRLYLQIGCEGGLTKEEAQFLGRTTPGANCAFAPNCHDTSRGGDFEDEFVPPEFIPLFQQADGSLKPTVDQGYAVEVMASLLISFFEDPAPDPTIDSAPAPTQISACMPAKGPATKRPAVKKRPPRVPAPTTRKGRAIKKPAKRSCTSEPSVPKEAPKGAKRKVTVDCPSDAGQHKRVRVVTETPAKPPFTFRVIFKGQSLPFNAVASNIACEDEE